MQKQAIRFCRHYSEEAVVWPLEYDKGRLPCHNWPAESASRQKDRVSSTELTELRMTELFVLEEYS